MAIQEPEIQTQPYANALQRDGFVVIENYLDRKECERLYAKITDIAESEIDVAEGRYSYKELATWGGAVIDKRTGRDDGMWDIFNADQAIPELEEIKNDPTVGAIITKAHEAPVSATNLNVYWNRSVTQTRAFHADTYASKFKAFTYLTDVTEVADGPFCYIRGSHRSSPSKIKLSAWINKLTGAPATNAVFYRDANVVKCTGPRGTLVIANQSGYHRGHPQQPGHERLLVATSYGPS